MALLRLSTRVILSTSQPRAICYIHHDSIRPFEPVFGPLRYSIKKLAITLSILRLLRYLFQQQPRARQSNGSVNSSQLKPFVYTSSLYFRRRIGVTLLLSPLSSYQVCVSSWADAESSWLFACCYVSLEISFLWSLGFVCYLPTMPPYSRQSSTVLILRLMTVGVCMYVHHFDLMSNLNQVGDKHLAGAIEPVS